MTSRSKAEYTREWDKAHCVYQTIKLRKELLADFKAACAARGERVNTVFRLFAERYVTDGDNGAQMQRQEGEWKPKLARDRIHYDSVCSVCGYKTAMVLDEWSYCPHCGVLMR